MTFHERQGLRYLTFPTLEGPAEVTHAVFTRRGGVSPSPWQSLNVGGGVGDERERVVENRQRCFRALGREPESIADLWQVHSDRVIVMEAPRAEGFPPREGDAMITDRANLTLFMRFGDCVPVLLFDPRRRVVGLVHAGWKGTLDRIAAKAVTTMSERFGTRPRDVLAAIGPSVGADHYPVGEEVILEARRAFGVASEAVLILEAGETHFDLWEANALALAEAGVESVEIARLCTACHLQDWFSHRGEHGRTGRFGALIALRE